VPGNCSLIFAVIFHYFRQNLVFFEGLGNSPGPNLSNGTPKSIRKNASHEYHYPR
jgi:hypothetical protein